MKRILILFLLVATLFSCQNEKAVKPQNQTTVTSKTPRVEVLDFYGTHRCVTCKAIESNSKYTLENFFPEEMKAGKLTFKTINVDDEANWDLAEKFEATGTALFLNVVDKNGKESHINLTDFAFAKGTNKEAFSSELKDKIDAELKKL